jgi:hypothetical protein
MPVPRDAVCWHVLLVPECNDAEKRTHSIYELTRCQCPEQKHTTMPKSAVDVPYREQAHLCNCRRFLSLQLWELPISSPRCLRCNKRFYIWILEALLQASRWLYVCVCVTLSVTLSKPAREVRLSTSPSLLSLSTQGPSVTDNLFVQGQGGLLTHLNLSVMTGFSLVLNIIREFLAIIIAEKARARGCSVDCYHCVDV